VPQESYRSHDTGDGSTNLWWVALLTLGEGWHNNHHAFPRSARHGLRWWELDMTYCLIRLLGLVGLARHIHLPAGVLGWPSLAAANLTEASRL
jgi:sn-1 stearoyl-lipid 9-desaturase